MNHMTRFCAEDNRKLIEYLKSKGVVKSSMVFDTMCLVDRKKYVNKFNPYNDAYIDAPQNVGHGRTISAPHMHGVIFEMLAEKLTSAKNALCIRCSTGYVSTCMAMIMGPFGTVFHIESIPELKEKIIKTIENAYPFLLWGNRIRMLDVENEIDGYPQRTLRYDVIYVGAGVAKIPQTLIDQLAPGGRMVIPIGPEDEQKLIQIDKSSDGKIEKRRLMSVRYGYLDSAKEKTIENNVLNLRKSSPNEMLKSSLSSENPNVISQVFTKQSLRNKIDVLPVLFSSTGSVNSEITSTLPKRLEIENDDKNTTQMTEKKGLQTIYHELMPTIEKKLELKPNETDLRGFQTEKYANQNTPNSQLKDSKLESILDIKQLELTTVKNKLRPPLTNKILEEKIAETYEKNFDKAIEKLKSELKAENLSSLYTDDTMKKLTLLLDKKLDSNKIDENLNVKIGSIEQGVLSLESEIKKFNDTLKQETNDQKVFLCEMDKVLKIKIEKLKNKIVSIEKDKKVMVRRFNNKIIKTKEYVDEKIVDNVKELNRQLQMIEETNELFAKEIKTLSINLEKRILQEKTNIYTQIDLELKEREQKQLNSVKNSIVYFEKEMDLLRKKLIDVVTNQGNHYCYCFTVFPTIITFHATYALFKNLS